MKKNKIIIATLIMLITISACTGGGSSSVTPSIKGKGSPERLE
jgi:hypothetical protein